jgi:ATP-binding cassette, subfamily C, bacterial CydCD
MRLFDRRLLREAGQARWGLGLAVGLGALGGVLTVLQARALSQAVDQLFLGRASLAGIRPLLAALLILALARAAAIWGGETAAGSAAARVKTGLRERLLGHLMALGPTYARGERTGELTNTAIEGVEALDAYFSQYLPQLALAALVPLTILAFVFPLDPVSGLVLLLTAPLIPLFMILIGSQADAMTRRQWVSLSRMSAHFLDVLQGLPTLKLFNRSRDQLSSIAATSDRHRLATMDVLRVAFLSALVLELVATISTAVVAVEVGLSLLYGRLAFEQAFFILILAPEFYLPLRLLGARFHAGVTGVTAAERIFEIADCRLPVVDCGPGILNPQSPIPSPQSAISFRNVSFAYPGDRHAALEDVSFDLLPGRMVALVGPSGGGKSTIAQLLLRFAEPSAGQITLDGRPARDLPAGAWRQQIAWMPQLPYLFNASVADNIRLGNPGASPDQMMHAAHQAGAHRFIQGLPLGYDTVIGERGARLSGGQAQRIALARAFLMDAPLVVLDEATANLDPETEAEIQASLERLLTGRTSLVIAHRLHTVYRADLILVLDRGRIVQAGAHAALAKIQDGMYARMLLAHSASETGHEGTRPRASEPAGLRAAEFRRPSGADNANPDPGDPASRAPAVSSDRSPAMATDPVPAGDAPGITQHASRFSAQPPVGTPHASRFTFHVLRFLLSFLTPVWPRVLLSVLLGFAAVACGIGLMGASAWIIASAALGPSIAELQVAIVGVRFFGIARGFARYGERVVSHDVTFRVLTRLRVWFYTVIEPLAPAGLARQRSGDLLSRVVGDIGTLENFYLRAVAPVAVAALTALLAGFLVGAADPRLAVALLLFLALGGVAAPLLVRALSRQPGRRMALVRGDLNAALVDGIQGVADLAAFGAAGAQLELVSRLSRDLSGLQRRMAAIGGLNSALVALCTGTAVLTILAGAAPLVAGGALSGVSLAVLVMIALASFEAVAPLPAAAQQLEGSLEAGRRLLALAEGVPASAWPRRATEVATTVRSNDFSRSATVSPIRLAGPEATPGISAENLRFRYEDAEPWALDGVSFELPPGGHLAIVGPSGSGKTTLVNLLLGFWNPREGCIRLASRDLRGMDPEAVRRNFGVVTQSTYLFSGTIRDNLLLAQPDAGQGDLDQAVARAQLADFIRSLPAGYDTWVGEYGLRLSGGERQRLAIARALLKDAPILILDEPVANLDPISARAVLDATRGLMSGRSVLSITHSLSGMQPADQVLVLRGGAVVERGRHAELLAGGGFYHRMWLSEQGSLKE